MKYVCIQCGRMLRVDRDLDDDRTFEYIVALHNETECPHAFLPNEDNSVERLRLVPAASAFRN